MYGIAEGGWHYAQACIFAYLRLDSIQLCELIPFARVASNSIPQQVADHILAYGEIRCDDLRVCLNAIYFHYLLTNRRVCYIIKPSNEINPPHEEELIMKPKILGVHHIALKAMGDEKYGKLMEFYRDILGMPVVREWSSGGGKAAMLDTGAGLLEIFSNATDELGMGALRHLAFAVEDTDACIEAVKAAGYKVTMEPTDIIIGSEPPYPARIAFCIGPVGEEVEFFKEK